MNTICNPKLIEITGNLFKTRVKDHQHIKFNILNYIESMGKYSFSQPENQQISNTDWHLSPETPRPYVDYLNHIFDDHNNAVMNAFGFDVCRRINCWFQQYEKGDYHIWHTHRGTMFSNVYYVSLDESCPKTSFKINGEEIDIDVEEGDIITFPSYLKHRSKPNQSDFIKTVIAFNTDFY